MLIPFKPKAVFCIGSLVLGAFNLKHFDPILCFLKQFFMFDNNLKSMTHNFDLFLAEFCIMFLIYSIKHRNVFNIMNLLVTLKFYFESTGQTHGKLLYLKHAFYHILFHISVIYTFIKFKFK